MDNFIDKLLEEIHKENLEKKKEGQELLKKLSEEGENFGWIKLFEGLE